MGGGIIISVSLQSRVGRVGTCLLPSCRLKPKVVVFYLFLLHLLRVCGLEYCVFNAERCMVVKITHILIERLKTVVVE